MRSPFSLLFVFFFLSSSFFLPQSLSQPAFGIRQLVVIVNLIIGWTRMALRPKPSPSSSSSRPLMEWSAQLIEFQWKPKRLAERARDRDEKRASEREETETSKRQRPGSNQSDLGTALFNSRQRHCRSTGVPWCPPAVSSSFPSSSSCSSLRLPPSLRC